MAADRTNIAVSVDVWQYLNQRKRPGESFDDVLRRELELHASEDGPQQPKSDGGVQSDPYHGHANDCPDCGERFDRVPELLEHMDEVPEEHFN